MLNNEIFNEIPIQVKLQPLFSLELNQTLRLSVLAISILLGCGGSTWAGTWTDWGTTVEFVWLKHKWCEQIFIPVGGDSSWLKLLHTRHDGHQQIWYWGFIKRNRENRVILDSYTVVKYLIWTRIQITFRKWLQAYFYLLLFSAHRLVFASIFYQEKWSANIVRKIRSNINYLQIIV